VFKEPKGPNGLRSDNPQVRGTSGGVKFLLVKDESDTFDRTPENDPDVKRLVLENAMDRLTGKLALDTRGGGVFFPSPVLIFNVSATLLPIFLRCQRDRKATLDCFIVQVPLLQSLTPPLSVGYAGFHGNLSRFVTESGITDG
jgi:hypothetical protein